MLLLNPNTGTLPGVPDAARDAEITLGIYRRHPGAHPRRATGGNPWGLRFAQAVRHGERLRPVPHRRATSSRRAPSSTAGPGPKGTDRWLPLYEAKMLTHYDHRFSTYEDATQASSTWARCRGSTDEQHDDPDKEPLARYWVAEAEVEEAVGDRWDRDWFLGWRDIASASDMRTFVPSVLPRSAVRQRVPCSPMVAQSDRPLLQAVWSSFVFDYVARQKLSGTQHDLLRRQAARLSRHQSASAAACGSDSSRFGDWVRPRVLELTYTSWRIASYATTSSDSEQGADRAAVPLDSGAARESCAPSSTRRCSTSTAWRATRSST